VASFAKSRPAKHEPGSVWNYSSGTTNIVSSIVAQTIAAKHDITSFVQQRLFAPIGMTSATARLDAAGTFIGSSYVHATAEDFARFGYLYLRGGLWDGDRILDASWVDDARRQHATDPDSGHGYGAHWWIWSSRPGTLAALGYEGQRTIVDYERDLVVVHLGKWPTETQPALDAALTRIIEAFPKESGRN
ncbi:MAG: serine hydrolase domain-containing protein, partial [Actinomycetota bacterium]